MRKLLKDLDLCATGLESALIAASTAESRSALRHAAGQLANTLEAAVLAALSEGVIPGNESGPFLRTVHRLRESHGTHHQ